MTCEVCGNTGHLGNDSPKTLEEAMFINNTGVRPQEGQGWNQPHPFYHGGNGKLKFQYQSAYLEGFSLWSGKDQPYNPKETNC
jgi:hypothetical protein